MENPNVKIKLEIDTWQTDILVLALSYLRDTPECLDDTLRQQVGGLQSGLAASLKAALAEAQ